MGEATHWCNRLLRDIRLSRGIRVVRAEANAVDLFIEFGAVVVAVYAQNQYDISVQGRKMSLL